MAASDPHTPPHGEFAARIATLGAVLGGDRIPLVAVAAGLLLFPFLAFDRIDLRWLAAGEAGLLAAGLLMLPRRRLHLLVFVVMLGAFCVACEGFHRMRSFGLAGLDWRRISPAEYGHPADGLHYDPSTYTGLAPGTEGIYKGRRFRVNDRGFRGPTFTEQKPPGVYRIVLAGASESVGDGLDEDERFSEQLVRRLNKSGLPVRVELINISIQGSKFGNLLHAVREEGMRYAPDMLMLQGNHLMFDGPTAETLSARWTCDSEKPIPFWDPKVKTISNRLFFGRLLDQARRSTEASVKSWLGGVWASSGWFRRGGAVKAAEGSPAVAPQEEGGAVERRLRWACDEWGAIGGDARKVLYVIPDNFDTARGHLQAVRSVFTPRGVTVINVPLFNLHAGPYADLAIYPGDNHHNAFANRLTAEALYDSVRALIVEDLDARGVPASPR